MTRRRRGDEGASLLLVLIVLLVVGVLALTTLTYVQVSYSGSDAVRQSRQHNYSADAAMDLAVKRLAQDLTGVRGSAADPSCSFALAGVNGLSSTVSCGPAAGVPGGPGPARSRHALLTLSSTKALAIDGTDELGVVGNVHANHTVETDQSNGSRLAVTGALSTSVVGGDCQAASVVATTKTCGTAAPVALADLTWAMPRVPSSAAGSVSCTTGAPKVAVFTQGSYKGMDARPAALVAAANTCASPKPSIWYFPPGAYYFEDTPIVPDAVTVVAGTAGAWWNGTRAVSAPAGDTACLQGSPGAQFILGGSSSISLSPTNRPDLSICASKDLSGGLDGIALYGVPANTTLSSATSTVAVKQLTSATALSTNNKQNVYMHGIVFLPTSAVDVNLQNKTSTYYDGGFVLDHGRFDVSASSKQIDSPISTLACTAASPCSSNRTVDLVASVGSVPWLRARVVFDDLGGALPERKYTIESWNVLR